MNHRLLLLLPITPLVGGCPCGGPNHAEAQPVLSGHGICMDLDVAYNAVSGIPGSLTVDYLLFDCDGADLPASTTVRAVWTQGSDFEGEYEGTIELFLVDSLHQDGVVVGSASSSDPDSNTEMRLWERYEAIVLELEVDGECGRIYASEFDIEWNVLI